MPKPDHAIGMTKDERIADAESRMTRPWEWKTCSYDFKHDKLKGFKAKIPSDHKGDELTLQAGMCPCAICGHEYMWECEDNDCDCCSPMCT